MYKLQPGEYTKVSNEEEIRMVLEKQIALGHKLGYDGRSTIDSIIKHVPKDYKMQGIGIYESWTNVSIIISGEQYKEIPIEKILGESKSFPGIKIENGTSFSMAPVGFPCEKIVGMSSSGPVIEPKKKASRITINPFAGLSRIIDKSKEEIDTHLCKNHVKNASFIHVKPYCTSCDKDLPEEYAKYIKD